MKRAFEVKEKTYFLVSQVLSFRLKKQTRKNVLDTNFKGCVCYIFATVFFVHLKERTCKTRKNVFYFTLKALFGLDEIKF